MASMMFSGAGFGMTTHPLSVMKQSPGETIREEDLWLWDLGPATPSPRIARFKVHQRAGRPGGASGDPDPPSR